MADILKFVPETSYALDARSDVLPLRQALSRIELGGSFDLSPEVGFAAGDNLTIETEIDGTTYRFVGVPVTQLESGDLRVNVSQALHCSIISKNNQNG